MPSQFQNQFNKVTDEIGMMKYLKFEGQPTTTLLCLKPLTAMISVYAGFEMLLARLGRIKCQAFVLVTNALIMFTSLKVNTTR